MPILVSDDTKLRVWTQRRGHREANCASATASAPAQSVVNPRRHLRVDTPDDEAIPFELAQRFRQHLLADTT
jgi:hypothetical protein